MAAFAALALMAAALLRPSVADGMTCGLPRFSSRIVGGTKAMDGEWPWQISLQYQGYHTCGASLISEQWVMCAAHCFEDSVKVQDFKVILGLYQLENATSHTVTSDVAAIYQNPNFTGQGSLGDIALLKLSKPVNITQYIMPICLPSSSTTFPCGMDCWVTGWGTLEFNATTLPADGILREVKVPLVDYKTCDQMYQGEAAKENATVVHIQNEKVCAGYRNGGKDSCQGDSGGPLVCQVQGVWYQVGVVSWGAGCGFPNLPGVYTLVSAYQKWISSYVQVPFSNVTGIPAPTNACPSDDPSNPSNNVTPSTSENGASANTTTVTPPQTTKATPPQTTKATPPQTTKATPPQTTKATPPQTTKATPPQTTKATPPQTTKPNPPQTPKPNPPQTPCPHAATTIKNHSVTNSLSLPCMVLVLASLLFFYVKP